MTRDPSCVQRWNFYKLGVLNNPQNFDFVGSETVLSSELGDGSKIGFATWSQWLLMAFWMHIDVLEDPWDTLKGLKGGLLLIQQS